VTLAGDRAQPTLVEVATRAGVSRATVSRVVNGSPRVSPQVRALVQRAIADLGYVPNRAARSLVTRRTDSIALVISEPEDRVFSEPFFARIIRGVSGVLADTDTQLVLVVAQGPAEQARLERYVAGGHVDGVLLASLHGDDPLPRKLEDVGVPVVLVGRPAAATRASYVDADNRGGAAMAVQHLLAGGRRQIATITGPLDMAAGRDRLDGYLDALRAAGAGDRDDLVEIGDFREESGVRAMQALLQRHPDLDAVFAASDLMAAGALGALRAAGRRVPHDVAVVGFDDSAIARWSEPPLTSVAQPTEEMGRQMARLLLARIGGEAVGLSVVLQTELVVRESG
jgi:DNA-binding LacI/PurR family transcriptional regulator